MTTNDMSNLVTDNVEEYRAQVKWYNPRENYGFATILDTNCDVFIHKKSIVGNCPEDERFWNKCLFENFLVFSVNVPLFTFFKIKVFNFFSSFTACIHNYRAYVAGNW